MNLWKLLPPETIKAQVLVPGGAFKMKFQFSNEGIKDRYFFVLNASPDVQALIVLSTATTKIEKRQRERKASVLVAISTQEYPELHSDSLVDCESLLTFEKAELVEMIGKYEVQPLANLPASLLKRIIEAIRASKSLAPAIKDIVLGESKT